MTAFAVAMPITATKTGQAFDDTYRGKEGPTDDPYQHDPEENAHAVDTHIPDRRSTFVHEGLMVFISAGEAYADQSGE